MKRLLLLLFVVFPTHVTHAQKWDFGEEGKQLCKFKERVMIDTSLIECVYQHTTYDAHWQEHRSEFDILLVGKQWAKYMDYDTYVCDSILSRVDSAKFTVNDYYNTVGLYRTRPGYILTRIFDRKIEYHDRIPHDNYVYEDSVPDMNWELLDDTMTVCDHLCQKAVTDFRGRRWEAWYCDVPINLGPWKFSGLPGLILKVQDTEEEHVFEALSLKRRNTGIYRVPHSNAFPEFTTTRERFNRALASYKANPFGSIPPELIPKATDAFGNPVEPLKRLFYNPMEKE